jgi:hypothetical protein
MRERIALSSSTQTAMKGLRAPAKIPPCRTAMQHEIFETDFAVF